jgi:nitrite reductase/ring-hydroxylating ferredoxin subunit
MSELEFHAVAKVGDLDEDEALKVMIGHVEIALYNLGGEIYASDNVCTHGASSLAEGFVENGKIECAEHGGCFDIKTGKAVMAPAVDDLRIYEVKIEGEQILVGVPAGN